LSSKRLLAGGRNQLTLLQSVKQIAETLADSAWQGVKWREGTKGAMKSRFAAVRFQPPHGYRTGEAPLPSIGLLIEWPKEETAPTKYWLSNLLSQTALLPLVRTAKLRWRVERDYQELKDELGLDHYEGRSWAGWHHHVTLTMLAHAFLTRERLRAKKTAGTTTRKLPSLQQVRREIQKLLHLGREPVRCATEKQNLTHLSLT
jgi:SRSO17 transposase